MKLLLPIILLSFFNLFGQNSCYENREGEYWPFHTDTLKYNSTKNEFGYMYSKDSVKIKDKYYFTRTKIDENGKVNESYLRRENNSVYYYNEKTESQSLLLPAKLEKGEKWLSTCGTYKYKIKSFDASLSTPFCDFEDLLEIEITNRSNNTKFQFFYKKGLGLVGNYIDNNPFSFILPEGKIENKNFIAYGCENIENSEVQRQCTKSKIIKYLQDNLSNPTPDIHGKIVYTILIDTEGTVEQVSIKSNDGASKKQEKVGSKVLKSLPNFIPAYAGSKPVKVIYSIPIAF